VNDKQSGGTKQWRNQSRGEAKQFGCFQFDAFVLDFVWLRDAVVVIKWVIVDFCARLWREMPRIEDILLKSRVYLKDTIIFFY
jgi:hypothetical protein